jgi:SAM-dependent methyltransferase
LDVACGNGNFARRLAARGARVVGFDFAEGMIERARAYPQVPEGAIEYAVVDTTDADTLDGLAGKPFDAAVANMALMDIVDIGPLLEFLAQNLRPGGRFVFSVSHPLTGTAQSPLRERAEDGGGEALEEPVFPEDPSLAGGDGGWADHFREFPPALVVRLRRPAVGAGG